MVVVVPSRGRPDNADLLALAWRHTEAQADLAFGLDVDDETLEEYPSVGRPLYPWIRRHEHPRVGMAGTLNALGVRYAQHQRDAIIGFMGDDHRPRTPGWDVRIHEAIAEMGGTGIVYGNDLIHGPGLPTAVFITADIIRALGYMAPPVLQHMYLDNYWKALGEGAGCLRYLPDVVIEHVHPLVGKAEEDDGYRRVAELMGPDGDAYEQFVASGGLAADIAKVEALVGARC